VSRRAVVVTVLLTLAGAVCADELPVRDPMRPFGSAAAAAAGDRVPTVAGQPRFALTGVLISPLRRVAFLNGKPYLQGAVVDGAEIVAIESSVVRLREHGVELVVSLGRSRSVRMPLVQGDTVP
jgi:hypothetical protein